jgi:hypothetical protein
VKLSELKLFEAHNTLTFPLSVAKFLDRKFYVYDTKEVGPNRVDYTIEELRSNRYRVVATENSVFVDPDIESGATHSRAKAIERMLQDLYKDSAY